MAWRIYAKDAITGKAVSALTSDATTPEAAAEPRQGDTVSEP